MHAGVAGWWQICLDRERCGGECTRRLNAPRDRRGRHDDATRDVGGDGRALDRASRGGGRDRSGSRGGRPARGSRSGDRDRVPAGAVPRTAVPRGKLDGGARLRRGDRQRRRPLGRRGHRGDGTDGAGLALRGERDAGLLQRGQRRHRPRRGFPDVPLDGGGELRLRPGLARGARDQPQVERRDRGRQSRRDRPRHRRARPDRTDCASARSAPAPPPGGRRPPRLGPASSPPPRDPRGSGGVRVSPATRCSLRSCRRARDSRRRGTPAPARRGAGRNSPSSASPPCPRARGSRGG